MRKSPQQFRPSHAHRKTADPAVLFLGVPAPGATAQTPPRTPSAIAQDCWGPPALGPARRLHNHTSSTKIGVPEAPASSSADQIT